MEEGGTEDDLKVSGLGNLLSGYFIKKEENERQAWVENTSVVNLRDKYHRSQKTKELWGGASWNQKLQSP